MHDRDDFLTHPLATTTKLVDCLKSQLGRCPVCLMPLGDNGSGPYRPVRVLLRGVVICAAHAGCRPHITRAVDEYDSVARSLRIAEVAVPQVDALLVAEHERNQAALEIALLAGERRAREIREAELELAAVNLRVARQSLAAARREHERLVALKHLPAAAEQLERIERLEAEVAQREAALRPIPPA